MRNNSRFRYLEKYVGKYRVIARYDLDTEDFPRDEFGNIDENFEDLYIPCSKAKSEIRHTYRDGVLCWYTEKVSVGRKLAKTLEARRNPIWFETDEADEDFLIYFKEKDFDEIAKLVKPKTTGAKIKPFSPKNLPKVPYEIPEKDLKKLEKVMPELQPIEKAMYMKKLFKEFDKVIKEEKGKKFNVEEERKKSKLKPKQFIHSIGMWKELIDFTKDFKC